MPYLPKTLVGEIGEMRGEAFDLGSRPRHHRLKVNKTPIDTAEPDLGKTSPPSQPPSRSQHQRRGGPARGSAIASHRSRETNAPLPRVDPCPFCVAASFGDVSRSEDASSARSRGRTRADGKGARVPMRRLGRIAAVALAEARLPTVERYAPHLDPHSTVILLLRYHQRNPGTSELS